MCSEISPQAPFVDSLTHSLKSGHPRLLASASRWQQLQQQRRNDQLLDRFLRKSEADARHLLTAEPVTYEKRGFRLLAVSRLVLQRVLTLSFHYRLSGDKAFAERAEQEMLAAAAFADWNPSHFLDTAEMTAALALGYDWLFDVLSPASRQTIRTAIIEKGLRPGLDVKHGWLTARNNWNQVCLGGLTLGALVIAEDERALAEQILQLAKTFNHHGLDPYAPDGVYPEGPMYWSYGTTYQVLLLAALESALHTDWGISKSPGFMESAAAFVQTIGPTGLAYSFFDGSEDTGLQPALFWFAEKLHCPHLLAGQRSETARYINSIGTDNDNQRFFVLTALWWPPASAPAEAASAPLPLPLPLQWHGRGENPLAIFRSAWDDPCAMYLALKGGKAYLPHGHMDAGSFVFESDGVRWAKDLGMQDYYSLESKGIQIWDPAQDGQRWQVFRLNNFSHNTLTLDGQLHCVTGEAEITQFSKTEKQSFAILDMTAVFTGQVRKAERGFLFRPSQDLCIVDELEGLKPGTTVRWTMVTGAEISLDGHEAILRQDGKELYVSLTSLPGSVFHIASADPSADGFNAPNPGIQILVADITAPDSGAVRIGVMLKPGSSEAAPDALVGVPLARW